MKYLLFLFFFILKKIKCGRLMKKMAEKFGV